MREEQQRREELRCEEQERRNLDLQLRSFDAYAFYESIESWANEAVHSPIAQTIQVTPLRRKVIMRQPLPLTRSELVQVRRLSDECVRLLTLLRAVDQKGMECPYVHRQHREGLEKAINKCVQIEEARKKYEKSRGLWSWCSSLFNGFHLDSLRRDVELFQGRLEAILMMCRHEEFACDLVHLRRAVTYRTGALLGNDSSPVRPRPTSAPKPVVRTPPFVMTPKSR